MDQAASQQTPDLLLKEIVNRLIRAWHRPIRNQRDHSLGCTTPQSQAITLALDSRGSSFRRPAGNDNYVATPHEVHPSVSPSVSTQVIVSRSDRTALFAARL